jgi:hypothetical protein
MRSQEIKWDHPIILQSHKGHWSAVLGIKGRCTIRSTHLIIDSSSILMPVDHSSRYFILGSFQHRVISWMTCHTYTQARNSSTLWLSPYPSPSAITVWVDNHSSNRWYWHEGDDLYFCDFLYQAWMQTSHQLSQRVTHYLTHDHILEQLMVEGTFDRDDMLSADVLAMQHSSAMCQ